MSNLKFELNKTALYFLSSNEDVQHLDEDRHSGPESPAQIVQITVRPAYDTNVGLMASYFCAIKEIGPLIKRIISLHRLRRLPSPTAFKGPGYTLVARHSAWPFGKQWLFQRHGLEEANAEEVRPADEKWTFTFGPDDYHDL